RAKVAFPAYALSADDAASDFQTLARALLRRGQGGRVNCDLRRSRLNYLSLLLILTFIGSRPRELAYRSAIASVR
ncbi:MAG TPA: hypothetical protein VJU59_43715, partial [Paraburkholderia sp.]|uniref:hypothetical protein n=1 Tax=Paraburkholderia sp. TaxID=1926495 RepID=UPI002B474290